MIRVARNASIKLHRGAWVTPDLSWRVAVTPPPVQPPQLVAVVSYVISEDGGGDVDYLPLLNVMLNTGL